MALVGVSASVGVSVRTRTAAHAYACAYAYGSLTETGPNHSRGRTQYTSATISIVLLGDVLR